MTASKLGRQATTNSVKVEITGKDRFWSRAFRIEWHFQFPERKLIPAGEDRFLVDPEWLGDIEAVAAQTFCRVVRAPKNPTRRQWLGGFLSKRDGR